MRARIVRGLATRPAGQNRRVPSGCGEFGRPVRQAGSPMRSGIACAVLPAGAAEFDTQRGACEFLNNLLVVRC